MSIAALALAALALACPQDGAAGDARTSPPPPPADLDEKAVVERCVALLLALQQDYTDPEAVEAQRREWPYEGVYREQAGRGAKAHIPLGYRVGGTAIVGWALVAAPGYRENDAAQAAVLRGLEFILEQLPKEGLRPGFNATYDVRGWAHAYALWFLLQLRAYDVVPEAHAAAVAEWIPSLIDTLETTEIRPGGGWNYSRPRGFDKPGNGASPFMTGPTLLALYAARAQGFEVDGEVVERALQALEATRLADGEEEFSYGYSRGSRGDGRPGAMGRITSAEVALFLAGRSDARRLQSGVQCFVEHWDQLEVRRQKSGTHVPPYGVAPYYVYFSHYHAALALSLLPEAERKEWRVKYLGRLFQSRLPSGGWNDRVFDRSEAYGTAMALLSLVTASAPPPPRWQKP